MPVGDTGESHFTWIFPFELSTIKLLAVNPDKLFKISILSKLDFELCHLIEYSVLIMSLKYYTKYLQLF